MRVAAVNYLLSPQGLVSHYRDVLERCALSHVDLAVLPENTSFELLFHDACPFPGGQDKVASSSETDEVDNQNLAYPLTPALSPLGGEGAPSPSPREGEVAPRSGDGGGNPGVPLIKTASGPPPAGRENWFMDQLLELRDFLITFSRETGMTIIAGTHLIEGENVAWQVAGGFIVPQTKNKMTTYEHEEFQLKPGSSLSPITKDIGTLICYDSEFPEAGRALAESGRTIISVPAFTETEHGFWRVRNSCLARAIENQVFVIHSSLVGSLGREPVPTAVGSSAIIAPSIEPYPAGGILAETEWNQEGIAIADISIDELLQARTKGDVRNWEDRTPDCWTVR